MHKLLSKIVTAASLALIVTGSAQAAIYTEDFEQPFPAWESNWFGTMSDAVNIYCNARNCTNRGNNPDGLWLGGAGTIEVTFDNAFGSSLRSFSFDVAAYGSGRFLSAYDMGGNRIFNQMVVGTGGAYSDPGVYTNYTINSSNGIARFGFSAGSAGNTSIDNLIAVTDAVQNEVPEPATMGLLGLGLFGVVAARSRRR